MLLCSQTMNLKKWLPMTTLEWSSTETPQDFATFILGKIQLSSNNLTDLLLWTLLLNIHPPLPTSETPLTILIKMEDNGPTRRALSLDGSRLPHKLNPWEAKMLTLNTFTGCATTLLELTTGPRPMSPTWWWDLHRWEPIILFLLTEYRTLGNGPLSPKI